MFIKYTHKFWNYILLLLLIVLGYVLVILSRLKLYLLYKTIR